MKISASIYSDKQRALNETIADLIAHQMDVFHVDCNDDLAVFEDIAYIQSISSIPIDLHIITESPEKYFELLLKYQVDYVTFQLEPLKSKLEWPEGLRSKKGIAIVTPTPVEAVIPYTDLDFLLIMATIPGQSGGVFDAVNFKKIRTTQRLFPNLAVHVDGGVNGEVSFVLRNMGVALSVSGSFLFKAPSIGQAMLELTKRSVHSSFTLEEFMIPLDETPTVSENASFQHTIEAVEAGKIGSVLVLSENGDLDGLVSNADIRKALIRHGAACFQLTARQIMNPTPFCQDAKQTASGLIAEVQKLPFIVNLVPVVEHKKARGIITFIQLIKGEA